MRSVGLLLLVSVAAFGQRAGGIRSGPGARPGNVRVAPVINSFQTPNTFGSKTGFGNVVYPGTGHAPPLPGSITDIGFASRFGATVGGFTPFTGDTVGRGRRGLGGGGVVYVPYPVGGYGGYGGYYGDSGEPPVNYVYQQQQPPPSPTVVINQNFMPETARPVIREYSSDPSGGIHVYEPQSMNSAPQEPAAPENPMYLIALKDHTIYATPAYWIEGDTLHYVTGQNMHNQVSLDLVDRELTNRLNRERSVDFRLPPARK